MQISELELQIGKLQDPHTEKSLAELQAVHSVCQKEADLLVELVFPYPIKGLHDFWANAIKRLAPGFNIKLSLRQKIRRHQASTKIASHPNIKNIIAVAACKGGVGKSTTTMGLARALQAQGAEVAVLDADIHGPNIPDLLRVSGSAAIKNKQFQPVVIEGLPTMSIAYCLEDDKPAIWRGPMVSRALEQLYQQTSWPPLDYLLIDLPPGTGDIQLTISKKIPLTGVVVVSTAETLALVDTIKGIEMFNKVSIPVLGLIENMARHICDNCGHSAALFGEGGAAAIAARYKIELLDSIAFNKQLQKKSDPVLLAAIYNQSARRLAVNVGMQQACYRVQFAEVETETGGKGGD